MNITQYTRANLANWKHSTETLFDSVMEISARQGTDVTQCICQNLFKMTQPCLTSEADEN